LLPFRRRKLVEEGKDAVTYLALAAPLLAVLALSYVARDRIRQSRLDNAAGIRTRSERMALMARRHGFVRLWYYELVSLAFVAIGLFLLVADRAMWPIGVLSIAFFGMGAVVFARVLILKSR